MEAILDTRKGIIIGKEEIMGILFHRGRMLLLDRIEVTSEKVIGEFQVTDEVCEGHAGFDGKLVLRGSDILDMAAQLLGVWAAQHFERLGRNCFVREYGGAKFKGTISPREKLTLEICSGGIKTKTIEKENGGQLIIISGENFLAMVGDKQKAKISFVQLVVL